MEAWTKSHEKFVSAADWSITNRGKDVYVFWQDGPWAVLDDPSYVLCAEESSMKNLSSLFGRVLSFTVETAGGVALFSCYEEGKLRRKIQYCDGETELEGEPLPEEQGIDVSGYYMDETEALWKAFGLSPFANLSPTGEFEAICVVDRTDYSEPIPGNPFRSSGEPKFKELATELEKRRVVSLTSAAASKLREAQEQDGRRFLRVGVASSVETGFMYDLKFDDQVSVESDYLDEANGITVVVDKRSALFLEGVTIDWQVVKRGQSGFHFSNPNAVG